MREIKFRVWWPNGKRMFLPKPGCDLLIRIDGKKYVQIDIEENTGLDLADPEMIWLQYTGLKDKNGREIFEGDLLSNGDYVMKVEWNQDAWTLNGLENIVSNGVVDHSKFLEVIGNIYENPELIKETP